MQVSGLIEECENRKWQMEKSKMENRKSVVFYNNTRTAPCQSLPFQPRLPIIGLAQKTPH
jgi:hypothetical protein